MSSVNRPTERMPIEQARAKLGDRVIAAMRGEATIITRHGKPAARLIPYVEDPAMDDTATPEMPDLIASWAASSKISITPHEGIWLEWDAASNTAYLAVWPSETCPLCGQSGHYTHSLIPPRGFDDHNWQHGCGHWWSPARLSIANPTPDDLDTALDQLRAAADQAVTDLTARLTEELRAFLALPKDELEHTGSELEPGIYEEDGEWVAWDFHPSIEGETITIYASDLPS